MLEINIYSVLKGLKIISHLSAHSFKFQRSLFKIISMSANFNGALLTAYLYLLYPIATFQKAGTCLDAQQSMAKQPIKGCVSNHSRTCGKSVSE